MGDPPGIGSRSRSHAIIGLIQRLLAFCSSLCGLSVVDVLKSFGQ